MSEPNDLVEEFYAPFVRPLGNLVILFAKAEAALLDLLTAMRSESEPAALEILKANNAKDQIVALIEASDIEGFHRKELLKGIEAYWSAKERRNRYIHDEWFIGILQPDIVPFTRGIPRKKGADVVWGEPDSSDIWMLALEFRNHEELFSYRAHVIRSSRPAT